MVDRGKSSGARSPFSILTVCYANRFRSPLAEHLLRHSLQSRGLMWEVRSAGTVATSGEAMDPRVRRILERRGIEVSEWRSSVIDRPMLDSADLVLTADHARRREVVLLNPGSLGHTFTLLQFARLASVVPLVRDCAPLDSGVALLDAAVEARSHLQPVPAGVEDIADPAGRSVGALRECAEVISAAVDQMMKALKH